MRNNAGDIVLTSRVRLMRNYADIPFPGAMAADLGAESELRAATALAHAPQGREYSLLRVRDMEDVDRRMLTEQCAISEKMPAAGEFASVLIRRDRKVSIMLNEGDHLKIQALLPGSALPEAAELAFEIDAALGKDAHFAFDSEFGFLTSCPAIMGTGMRASALLHLPSLTRSGLIDTLAQAHARLGFSLGAVGGKESAAEGELYLLSNHVTLGRSEEELLSSLETTVSEIVDRERQARELLLVSADLRLEDRLFRSFGILRYARRLSEAEWKRRWSDVRLGVQAGYFATELSVLDRLLFAAKPAHLEKTAGKALSPAERDELRAQVVREALS